KYVREAKKKSKFGIISIFIMGFIIGTFSTSLVLESRGERTHITIIYSSEKASWMTIAYSNFMDEWQNTHPDEPISIDMHPYGSSNSIISILNREIYPTIWSPASSIWMPFLNSKWADLTKSETPIVNISAAVKIIYSPIVIATWESFNRTYNIKGFNDIHNLTLNPNVNIKMAHTDPRLSNSGFMSVIMALSAFSGVSSENLSMSDLTNLNNQQWLREFESSAVVYGTSTGFLARYMKSEGPSSLNIVFLYENLIRDISSTATGGKIIAVYPEEGTLYSDHPFCILNADWISPQQRLVAEAFLNFLNDNETVVSALEYGFRPINPLIPLDPRVFNYETNGIAYDLNVPELNAPLDEEVLLKIPDLWQMCKAIA
ncbi:MAG: substrate-binding domain-containing protein, partial [Candidatus Odinarchaeota archaeon]